MIRHGLSLVAIAALLVACGTTTSSVPIKPSALYSVIPTQADVRKLMGDSNWYAGPPSFRASPVPMAAGEVFSIEVEFLHLGSGEALVAFYQVIDSTIDAQAVMALLQSDNGQSPTSPKVGDQVLYYGSGGSAAAPFLSKTFVRVGRVVVTIGWTRKDSQATLNQLARNARVFIAGLQKPTKAHSTPAATPSPVAAKELPPPGLDVTLLGSTHLPIEAFVVMSGSALPDTLTAVMRQSGVDTFAYGDYALNADPHMEVQTALLTFGNEMDAATFAKDFGPGTPDSNGIYFAYIPLGGTPASGEYVYVTSSGTYAIYMICKANAVGEVQAATRECETPTHRTAVAWQLALQGIG